MASCSSREGFRSRNTLIHVVPTGTLESEGGHIANIYVRRCPKIALAQAPYDEESNVPWRPHDETKNVRISGFAMIPPHRPRRCRL